MVKKANENRSEFEVIRSEMLAMQKMNGAAITPLILYRVYQILLSVDKRTDISAKTVADTVCALCNELYLANYRLVEPTTEFVLTERQWEKYCIDPSERKKVLDYITNVRRIITINKKPHLTEVGRMEEVYCVPASGITDLRKAAEMVYAEERPWRQ